MANAQNKIMKTQEQEWVELLRHGRKIENNPQAAINARDLIFRDEHEDHWPELEEQEQLKETDETPP